MIKNDEQVTATAKLELDTTDAENKIKAIRSELENLDVHLSNYSNFKYKLDIIKAFAWGASVGAAMFVLVIIACGMFGWIKYLN